MVVSVWMRCLRAETEIEGFVKFRILCFPSSNFTNTWCTSDPNISIASFRSKNECRNCCSIARLSSNGMTIDNRRRRLNFDRLPVIY